MYFTCEEVEPIAEFVDPDRVIAAVDAALPGGYFSKHINIHRPIGFLLPIRLSANPYMLGDEPRIYTSFDSSWDVSLSAYLVPHQCAMVAEAWISNTIPYSDYATYLFFVFYQGCSVTWLGKVHYHALTCATHHEISVGGATYSCPFRPKQIIGPNRMVDISRGPNKTLFSFLSLCQTFTATSLSRVSLLRALKCSSAP